MVSQLACEQRPIILAGNDRFFSAGAELEEICALNGPSAYEFSNLGQTLMNAIDCFPAPVCAAISGYSMGGGLDLALAADIASPPRMPCLDIGAQPSGSSLAGEAPSACRDWSAKGVPSKCW
jgi:hypothetical protein